MANDGTISDSERSTLIDSVQQLIVRRLRLELDPADIDVRLPLFESELGLDSIDALELVIGLEHEFGIFFREQRAALESVDTIVDFIIAQRTRGIGGSV